MNDATPLTPLAHFRKIRRMTLTGMDTLYLAVLHIYGSEIHCLGMVKRYTLNMCFTFYFKHAF